MSLLWRRHRLRIGFCPDRLIVGEDIIHTEAPLEALSALLAGKRKTELTVVLANAYVRYALLPPSEALKTEAQWLAFARHRLAAVHGAASADWEMRMAESRGGRIVAAVEPGLLRALEETADGAGATLVSVQPYLMAAFNALRARLAHGAWWLAIEEPGRLTLALVRDGTWTALRTRRIGAGWRGVLPELLERESALAGVDAGAARAIVCGEAGFEPEDCGALALEPIDYRQLATRGA